MVSPNRRGPKHEIYSCKALVFTYQFPKLMSLILGARKTRTYYTSLDIHKFSLCKLLYSCLCVLLNLVCLRATNREEKSCCSNKDNIIIHRSANNIVVVAVLTIVLSCIGMKYNYRILRNVFGMSSTP